MTPNETRQHAKRLLASARKRAPSFVFLNMIFNEELQHLTDDKNDQEQIRNAAREIENAS